MLLPLEWIIDRTRESGGSRVYISSRRALSLSLLKPSSCYEELPEFVDGAIEFCIVGNVGTCASTWGVTFTLVVAGVMVQRWKRFDCDYITTLVFLL